MKQVKQGFKITRGKGFHITFKNGVTVSVQFGLYNYRLHYNSDADNNEQLMKDGMLESPDAEIAIFDAKGKWLTNKWQEGLSDDIKGYVEPGEVLDALIWAEKYKKKEI